MFRRKKRPHGEVPKRLVPSKVTTAARPVPQAESGNLMHPSSQGTLVSLGYPMPITTKGNSRQPDGIFGQETYDTVKAFQRKEGLVVDGVVGRNTITRLDTLCLPDKKLVFAAGFALEQLSKLINNQLIPNGYFTQAFKLQIASNKIQRALIEYTGGQSNSVQWDRSNGASVKSVAVVEVVVVLGLVALLMTMILAATQAQPSRRSKVIDFPNIDLPDLQVELLALILVLAMTLGELVAVLGNIVRDTTSEIERHCRDHCGEKVTLYNAAKRQLESAIGGITSSPTALIQSPYICMLRTRALGVAWANYHRALQDLIVCLRTKGVDLSHLLERFRRIITSILGKFP